MLMVKFLQQTELQTAVKNEPFGDGLVPFWKQEIVFSSMLEYEDCKMKIQKVRKIFTALDGNKMQPRS